MNFKELFTDRTIIQDPPKDAKIDLGATFQAMGPNGRPAVVSVVAIVGDEITLDHNSPMAGKTLHFDVEMVEIKKA